MYIHACVEIAPKTKSNPHNSAILTYSEPFGRLYGADETLSAVLVVFDEKFAAVVPVLVFVVAVVDEDESEN